MKGSPGNSERYVVITGCQRQVGVIKHPAVVGSGQDGTDKLVVQINLNRGVAGTRADKADGVICNDARTHRPIVGENRGNLGIRCSRYKVPCLDNVSPSVGGGNRCLILKRRAIPEFIAVAVSATP